MAAGLGDVRTRLHQQMNGEGKEPSNPEEDEEAQAKQQARSAYASTSADHKEDKHGGKEGSKEDSSPVVIPVHETTEADLD